VKEFLVEVVLYPLIFAGTFYGVMKVAIEVAYALGVREFGGMPLK
jgi:hypothetical protein